MSISFYKSVCVGKRKTHGFGLKYVCKVEFAVLSYAFICIFIIFILIQNINHIVRTEIELIIFQFFLLAKSFL